MDKKIQYNNVEQGIIAHAEDYSFNIESELFSQLTPEQQKLWRKEIEHACISGGYAGLNLGRDKRYPENREPVSEELEEEIVSWLDEGLPNEEELIEHIKETARHFANWQKEQIINKGYNWVKDNFPSTNGVAAVLSAEIFKEEMAK